MRYRKLEDLQKDIETLDGTWDLSPDHEVTYKERGSTSLTTKGQLLGDSSEPGAKEKKAGFKAQLVAAEPDALVVSVTVEEDEKRTVTGLVKLSGKWQLDEQNRITFSVKKAFDQYDTFTFQGAWEVNKNHEVVYTFTTKQVLEGSGKKRRRVTKVEQELVFKGEWDPSEENQLTYLIGADSSSAFRIRGTFESASLLAKEGAIRYRAGIEYKTARGARKKLTQTITLFGEWKLSKDLALTFAIEYADGRRSEMRVGADITVPDTGSVFDAVLPDTISANLVSRTGKPLGLELVLTKDFFAGDAQLFVRFIKNAEETKGEFGVKIPW